MTFRPWLLALTLLGAPMVVAGAPARSARADEASFDVSVFYERLAPYGDWVSLEGYGWVWVPQAADCLECAWRPYTVGSWAFVEPYGWTWVSTEDWGWATYHYGRWLYTDDYGWVWVPGTVWAPAWVSFRFGDGWVGWAPLPPTPRWRIDAGVDSVAVVEASIGAYAWAFVPVRWFGDADLSGRYAAPVHAPYLVARTAPSTRLVVNGDFVVNRSLDVAAIERARGRAVVRYKPNESTDPARGSVHGRLEGDSVPIFRARIAPTDVKKAPTPRVAQTMTPKDVDAWVEKRRVALKAHLDAQRLAADRDLDDSPSPAVETSVPGRPVVPTPPTGHAPTPTPTPPPPGGAVPPVTPAPPTATPSSAADVQARRDAAKKALEEEQKRLERLLERQRNRLEHKDGTPESPPPPPPPKGKDKDKKDKD